MSHTSFVKHIKDNTLSPFAMCEAFPRSDYYGGSVTMSDFQRLNLIADLCRRSDLGNPHLPCNDEAFVRLSDMVSILWLLLAVALRSVLALAINFR